MRMAWGAKIQEVTLNLEPLTLNLIFPGLSIDIPRPCRYLGAFFFCDIWEDRILGFGRISG
jgi:hypothetical protein